MTRAQVARYVGVSYPAVDARIKRGKLRTKTEAGVRFVFRASVDQWVQEREQVRRTRYAQRLARKAALDRLINNTEQP